MAGNGHAPLAHFREVDMCASRERRPNILGTIRDTMSLR